jgi:hypothetical protein
MWLADHGATRVAQAARESRAAANLTAVKQELKNRRMETSVSTSLKWERSERTLNHVDGLIRQSNHEHQQWRDYMASRVRH